MLRLSVFVFTWLLALCSFAQVQERGTELLDGSGEEINRIRAVLVGVSKYANLPPQAQLKYAHSDAEKVLEYLTALEGYEKDITLFMDEEATYPEVRKKLYEYLFMGTRPNDLVIFYFAGHGDVDLNVDGGFLLMHEAGSTDYAIGDAFPISEIQRFMDSASERHKIKSLLITDACRAGVALTKPLLGAGKTLSALLNNWAYTVKLVSCQPNQYSYELDKFGQGIFTYFLIEGLQGKADRNKDKKVTVSELYRYVTDQIERELDDKQLPGVAGNTTLSLVSLAEPELKMVQSFSPMASARSNPQQRRKLMAVRPAKKEEIEIPDSDVASDDPPLSFTIAFSLSEEDICAYGVKVFLENGWLTPLEQPAANDSLMKAITSLFHQVAPPQNLNAVSLMEHFEREMPALANLSELKYEVAMALERAARPVLSQLTDQFQFDRQALAKAHAYLSASAKLLAGDTILVKRTAMQQQLVRANLYLAENDLVASAQLFDSLIATGQGGAIAYYGKGLAYQLLNNNQMAIQAYENAQNTAYYWLAPTQMMANLYLEEGEFAAAFEVYDRFLAKNPGDVRALAGLDRVPTPAMLTSVRAIPEHEKLFLLEQTIYALRGKGTSASTDSLQQLYFTQGARITVLMAEGKKQTFSAKGFLKWWLEKNPDLKVQHASIFIPGEASPFAAGYKKVKGEMAELEASNGMFIQKKTKPNLHNLGVGKFDYGGPLPFRFHTLEFKVR